MVFIHYGGFFAGTGNSDYLGPEYFMDKNVILVTFNYRLGVFGKSILLSCIKLSKYLLIIMFLQGF